MWKQVLSGAKTFFMVETGHSEWGDILWQIATYSAPLDKQQNQDVLDMTGKILEHGINNKVDQ